MTRVSRALSVLICLLVGVVLIPSRGAAAPAIGGGSRVTAVVKPDGTVWTWGQNQEGQLGDGSTTERWVPGQVSGLTDVISIAVGAHFRARAEERRHRLRVGRQLLRSAR